MTVINIPAPTSAGVMLSYKCSAACRHCMYACGPDWPADWMSRADLELLLAQLARTIRPSPWGRQAVGLSDGLHFTGGEPFLNFDLLLEATRLAEQMDIPSTFVETNCAWCGSDDVTRRRLQDLKQAGLKGIMISVNPFYAEFVPFEKTERCIRIGQEVFGQNVIVYQLEFYRQFKRLGIRSRLAFDDYRRLAAGDPIQPMVEMFLMGRAAYELAAYFPTYPAHTFFSEACQPAFLRSWHNHFDNYGNFMPGFCGGISLGSWRELTRLIENGIDLEHYPVLGFLVAEDMAGLFGFAVERGYRERPDGYVSKCHLCLDLRRHLAQAGEFTELNPTRFYAQFA